MNNTDLRDFLDSYCTEAYLLLQHYLDLGRPLLLHSELQDELERFCRGRESSPLPGSALAGMIQATQEAALQPPWICLAVRPAVARWYYLRFHVGQQRLEQIPVEEFLAFKEQLVGGGVGERILEIDLEPFNREFPRLQQARSIGRGVEFLNRRLSSDLFQSSGSGGWRLLGFLRVHQHQGIQLMLDQSITSVKVLRHNLQLAEEFLATRPSAEEWPQVQERLRELGFEPGWGRNVERMRDTMRLLADILEAPDPVTLERFLGRIPMIFRLAIISPHGFFGQNKVLGLPDTGGQVVYILDQVRALEREMQQRIFEQGLDIEPRIMVLTRLLPEARGTSCDQPLEQVEGTSGTFILRVPFRTRQGEVVPHWISRFEVWPYLERFAAEAGPELVSRLGGRPDLIIGNYSDGNLVATLLAQDLRVTQCNIAHALEKTKYLYSDLYWQDNEEQYHFAAQFTADLIAMNSADFIITSTYQEIAGRSDSVGQYESYQAFTMPGLYRVVNGIDIHDPKFNIISPGADSRVYFPAGENGRRRTELHDQLQRLLFGPPDESARGELREAERPLLFTMARLDRIKNITGLVEWFGRHRELRGAANLLVIAGHVDATRSSDREEQEQIARMHQLMDQYQLDGELRWLGLHLEKELCGELYRYIADRHGAFIQPALFEAFGLTVIEAMSCGLPVFATQYGGPLEIIEDGQSGFHIDPNHGMQVAQRIADFLARCRSQPGYWEEISGNAIARVEQCYTWEHYARRLMTLSRIYGFWRYVTDLERKETRRYLEMFYNLQFKPLADRVPRQDG